MTSRPDPRYITPDTPLRLFVAAQLAFPDESMTAGALRREAKRGRLRIERIAGRDYTTMRAIEEMRQQCHVHPKDLASTDDGDTAGKAFGSSETANMRRAQAALSTTLKELKKRSKSISPESEKAPAQVVQLRS
jgi:hypothetical protein